MEKDHKQSYEVYHCKTVRTNLVPDLSIVCRYSRHYAGIQTSISPSPCDIDDGPHTYHAIETFEQANLSGDAVLFASMAR